MKQEKMNKQYSKNQTKKKNIWIKNAKIIKKMNKRTAV